MACRLILVRHGQTDCTVRDRFCGTHNVGLTAVGSVMAERVAEHPALREIELVVTSPSGRARATAAPLAVTGVPTRLDERLCETTFGKWEGLSPHDVRKHESYCMWQKNPAAHSPPGGESGLEVAARVVAATRDALEDAAAVALVTHKAPVRLLLSLVLDLPLSRYRDLATVPVGSISEIRFTDRTPQVVRLGDVGHLPTEWRDDPDHACTPCIDHRGKCGVSADEIR